MAEWTVARAETLCGQGCLIPAGAPVQLLIGGRQRRCAAHAHGEVDWPAVETARQAIEAERRDDIAARLRGERRLRPSRVPRARRPLQPASEVQTSLYDPRARAANDHHDEESQTP